VALQGHPGTTAEFFRTLLISRMRGVGLAIAIVTAVLPFSVRATNEVFASIGTGELSGIYYPVGNAICDVVNQDLRTNGVRCSAETTPGSVYNIEALQSGELEFAIVQSDVQYYAYTGEGPWIGRAFRSLRSVVSLYPELVTVIVRANSQIHDLADLAGRRVNVGSEGSGTRATWDAIEAAVGWRDAKRVHPVALRADATTSALCSGEIDANLMIVGHPSPLVTAQQAACPVNFVAINGSAVDKLVHDHQYYQYGTIGGGAYGIAAEVPTFGVRATLVTSASVDARVVAVCTKELLTHLGELRALHPALAGLTAGEMIKDGLTAPPHPGAAQVYKELELR
jgi:TRAP transporter TAXI family solute receptor